MVFGWFWLLLVVVVIVAVALTARERGRDDHDSAAEEALARRYAEGQIDEDEYRRRSATLTASRPPRRSQASWWPLAIAVGAILLLVTALLWGGMGSGWMWNSMGRHMGWTETTQTAGGGQALAEAPTVEVTANDLAFDPSTITIDAGQPTNVRLINEGQVFHDLTIPDLDVQVAAEPGGTATTAVTIDTPGSYEFLCTVPGHADAGMRGTLTVE